MIGGYNHNVTYRGTAFHVQTEDSGLKRPQLVTLLYHGGTVISSQKTLYDDIIKVENLDQVLEELAKEQHKGMLRRLTKGEFDQRIAGLGISLAGSGQQAEDQDKQKSASGPVPTAPETVAVESNQARQEGPVAIAPVVDRFRKTVPEKKKRSDLDELIYAYLTAGRKSL